MTMDANTVRGLVNQILYGIDRIPQLDDTMVARCADSIIQHRNFAHPAAEYQQAIDAVLRDGHLSQQALALAAPHSESALLDFLGRLAQRLAQATAPPSGA
jgi:hypothetical protein